MTITGQLTLSPLDDDQLIIVIQAKKNHEGFKFDPAQMTLVPNFAPPNLPHPPCYANVILTWADNQGLKAVETLLNALFRNEQARTEAARTAARKQR